MLLFVYVLVSPEHSIDSRGLVRHHLLLHVQVVDPGWDLQLARRYHLQQGRLARTVGAHQAIPLKEVFRCGILV